MSDDKCLPAPVPEASSLKASSLDNAALDLVFEDNLEEQEEELLLIVATCVALAAAKGPLPL